MAMGKRKQDEQSAFWVATDDLPRSVGHPFYERLNKILDTDPGARYFGEFAIGFNPYVLHPMKDTLFDEKIAGSFHFTPGNSYDPPGGNGNVSI